MRSRDKFPIPFREFLIYDPSNRSSFAFEEREPDNCKDKYAVAIVLEDCVVGHVPYNLAKCVSQFLSRDANKGFARVTGSKVNRGAG